MAVELTLTFPERMPDTFFSVSCDQLIDVCNCTGAGRLSVH